MLRPKLQSDKSEIGTQLGDYNFMNQWKTV